MPEEKTPNTVFLIPIIAIVIGALIYFLFIGSFNNYGTENNRFINLLDSYESMPKNSILFISDSQTREDIDCLVIESELVKNHQSNTSCFNLGLAGILPTQLVLEKDLIIKAKPKIIILGVSPLFFNEDVNKNNDLYLFMIIEKELSLKKHC